MLKFIIYINILFHLEMNSIGWLSKSGHDKSDSSQSSNSEESQISKDKSSSEDTSSWFDQKSESNVSKNNSESTNGVPIKQNKDTSKTNLEQQHLASDGITMDKNLLSNPSSKPTTKDQIGNPEAQQESDKFKENGDKESSDGQYIKWLEGESLIKDFDESQNEEKEAQQNQMRSNLDVIENSTLKNSNSEIVGRSKESKGNFNKNSENISKESGIKLQSNVNESTIFNNKDNKIMTHTTIEQSKGNCWNLNGIGKLEEEKKSLGPSASVNSKNTEELKDKKIVNKISEANKDEVIKQ